MLMIDSSVFFMMVICDKSCIIWYVLDPEPCPDTAIYLWALGATASGFFLYSIIISAIVVGKAVSPIN